MEWTKLTMICGRIMLLWAVMTVLGSIVAAAEREAQELVYIGTRGSNAHEATDISQPSAGEVQGIYGARLDTETGQLSAIGQVAQLNRAQWLTRHPRLPVLYAVHGIPGPVRTSPSLIDSFSIDASTGKLKLLNVVDAGGRDATQLVIDLPSSTLFSANHGDGSISALSLRPDGSLGEVSSVQVESGSGPVPGRQEFAQAHGLAVDPTGKYVLVADLGADRVFIYRFDRARRVLTPAGSQAVPPGSGPRHLLFDAHGRFVYLLTDMTSMLHVFDWDARHGRLRPLQSLSTYPAGYTGKDTTGGAEIAMSGDGRFVYICVRGDQNSIVAYAVDQRAGTVKEIQRIAAGGKSPRGFAIDPSGRWLLATNDGSDTVSVLKVDPVTGRLGATGQTLSIPGTVSIVFRSSQHPLIGE
jgi:6-phosphogluconolactonase